MNAQMLEVLSGQRDTAPQLGLQNVRIVKLQRQSYQTATLSGLGKRDYPYGIEN